VIEVVQDFANIFVLVEPNHHQNKGIQENARDDETVEPDI